MITKERYEILKDALGKGANLAPIDFKNIDEYEAGRKIQLESEPFINMLLDNITFEDKPRLSKGSKITMIKYLENLLENLYVII